VTNRQTNHATCVATGRIFTLCIAMRAKNYSERQNWRHQFREQHAWNKARCKRAVIAVGGNCTRAMCVRARRSQCSSTESARSPPQRLYIPVSRPCSSRATRACYVCEKDVVYILRRTYAWLSQCCQLKKISHTHRLIYLTHVGFDRTQNIISVRYRIGFFS